MFFVKWIAPVILGSCGIFMMKMGVRWFRSGHPMKAAMDMIAGASFLVIGLSLPFMV